MVAALCCAIPGALTAQTPQPFLPPVHAPHFALQSEFAAVDVNRDGSVDVLSPGLFFGTRLSTLDEHGQTLAESSVHAGVALTPRSALAPRPVTFAAADLDGDDRDDLVFAQPDGSVFWQRNLGATRTDATNFATPQVIDYLGHLLPAAPPFAVRTFADIEVVDVDHDGHLDVLVGGGVHDVWNAAADPGVLACYLGDGAGSFTRHRLPLTGSVTDLEWADVDGDGLGDHVVAVQERGGVGAFFQDLLHVELQSGGLALAGPPQMLVSGRATSLEVGDLDLDGRSDYLLSLLFTGGAAVDSAVVCIHGNGTTSPGVTAPSTLPLPAAPGVGSFIPSVQVADFNRDGLLDVATLRGHLATFPTTAANAQVDSAHVYVHMGPFPLTAPADTMPLGALVSFGHCEKVSCGLLPIRPSPDQLRVLDLGADGNPDLMLAGARGAAAPTTPIRVTLRNSGAPHLGEGAFVKVGEPSGGDPELSARIGFEGAPRVGNPAFTCTLQNLNPGCVCGLMWGTFAQANLVHVYGCDLHVGAQEFGYVKVTHGPADAGFTKYALPVPNHPALIGDAGYFQFNYWDPSVQAFGATQATGVWIGG
ncbi:MAG: FG-GAP repeat domain-containing protein [Planctomycetota bacterium]